MHVIPRENSGASAPAGGLTRRRFLGGLAVAGGALLLPARVRAHVLAPGERSVSFLHTHTGERLEATYWAEGAYQDGELALVNHLLRDFRTGDEHRIDPALLDQLHELARITGTREPFQVISGYRTPQTNAELRSIRGGQATHSLHLTGQAIDIRLADVSTEKLRDAALGLQRGGVGYYPLSGFVHVDTGRVRRW